MSDTGTQTPPTQQSEFFGAASQPTPEQLRAEQARINGLAPQYQQAAPPVVTKEEHERQLAAVRNEFTPRLEQISGQLAALQAEREAERAAREAAEKEAADAATAAAVEAEAKLTLTQRFEQHKATTDAEFRRIAEERQIEQAVFAREREFSSQSEYRTTAIAARQDEIMPQLRDLVAFGGKEDVDRSIEDMIARSHGVITDVQTAQQQAWTGQRGVSPTAPAAGPLENNLDSQPKQLSAQDIASMSVADYARNRGALLQAASRQWAQGQRR